MRQAAFLTVVFASLLAGCTPATDVSRNSPYGVDANGEAVDGMTVGHRLMEAGEPELALKAYLRGAGETGINADTLSSIGSANLALGRLGQAEKILRRALELDPDFVPALNNLGVVLMEKDNAGEARVMFQKAFALDSGETDSIRENLMLAIARSEAKRMCMIPPKNKKLAGSVSSGKRRASTSFSPISRRKRVQSGYGQSKTKDAEDAPSGYPHAVPWRRSGFVGLSEQL